MILFFVWFWAKSPQQDKKPIAVLLSIFAVVVLFWKVFKQNGSALNTWADKYTNRSVENPTAAKILTSLQLAKPTLLSNTQVHLPIISLELLKMIKGKNKKYYNMPITIKIYLRQKYLNQEKFQISGNPI
jgi:proton-dependent oligopeptide transporter, POT family